MLCGQHSGDSSFLPVIGTEPPCSPRGRVGRRLAEGPGIDEGHGPLCRARMWARPFVSWERSLQKLEGGAVPGRPSGSQDTKGLRWAPVTLGQGNRLTEVGKTEGPCPDETDLGAFKVFP